MLFELKCKLADIYAYTSIVDHTLTSIEVCNNFNKTVVISYHTLLSWIIEYEADSCFLISSDLLSQADSSKLTNWVKVTFQTLLITTVIYYIVFNISVESEHQLQNEITVYEQITTAVTALTDIVSHYLDLWEDKRNITDISENEWIKILLLNNWQKLYKSEQVKMYSLLTKNCEVVDEVFNKLHKQSCITWITQSVSFTYLYFVV